MKKPTKAAPSEPPSLPTAPTAPAAPALHPAASGGDAEAACIFCKIIAGEVPSWQIYEDETCVAFLDVGAWHRGHTLVVPRRHVPDLVTGPPALPEIAAGIDRVARLLKERLAADGINLLSSAGAIAGQEVFHMHVHVVPRYADEPGLLNLVSHAEVPEGELESVYRQISGGR